MYVLDRLPSILRVGVSFPFDQVLQSVVSSIGSMTNDGLDLIFFRAFHDVWGRFSIIFPVFSRLVIRREE